MIDSISQDLRHALRMLFRQPVFAATVILTLGLGIGLSATLFTILDAVVLRPLPVDKPEQIVKVYQQLAGRREYRSFSHAEYAALRDSNQAFSELIAYGWMPLAMGSDATGPTVASVPIQTLLVSDNYLSGLGATASPGRIFSPETTRNLAEPVAVVSDSAWRRLFASDPDIVRRGVILNGARFTVLGVAGRDFGGTDPQVPDFWIPLRFQERLLPGDHRLDDKRIYWLDVAARLKPAVSVENAAAEMGLLVNRAAKDFLDTDKQVAVSVVRASFLSRPDERAQVTSTGIMAFGAVTLVLLIACANVTNLVLAKAIEREREIAVRISLGATRMRLMRQFLLESVVVSLMGGSVGLLLALVLPELLVRLLQPPAQQQLELHLSFNPALIVYSLLLSIATGLMIGLAPARQAGQTTQARALNGGGSFLPAFTRASLQDALVVAQVSLCLILVMSAALLGRALQSALTIQPGFETQHVLVCDPGLHRNGYSEAQAQRLFQQLRQELAHYPDIQTSSVASLTPLGGVSISAPIVLQDSRSPEDASASVNYHVVSAEYFKTLGIALVKGRLFTQDDVAGGAPVAVINQAMAQRYWPNQDALGKRFRPGPPSVPVVEVAGIVRDARLGRLWEDAQPYFFLPALSEAKGPPNQTSRLRMKLLVRTNGDPAAAVTTISRLVQRIDPALQPSVERLEKHLDRWLWFSRVGAILATVLGLIALVLALVGIASISFFHVARRRREIGIRLAVGATSGDIQRWVLRRGVTLVAGGIAAGLLTSAVLSRVLSAFLYSVSPLDPAAFVAASIVMLSTAFLGNYLPARQASMIAPTESLRSQ